MACMPTIAGMAQTGAYDHLYPTQQVLTSTEMQRMTARFT
jgi:hypothetical protein